jgi:tRNA A37 methylthiotransferase MiaB
MNRQYRRGDFLRMLDRVQRTFDRPALTTDVIVAFPGENDAEFEQTVDIALRARFIHVHAFPFSPRPGTAAARWTSDFVRGPIVGQRIDRLGDLSRRHSHEFRRGFLGHEVEIAVEQDSLPNNPTRHGRCERYFDVEFAANESVKSGDLVRVRIEQATIERTIGQRIVSHCPT